ncbi:MAG: VWA domain-containing protein [Bacteroidales bacterium]|nr:VWA domain-containing protein [Bacteroidales bacterium]
MVKSHFLHLLTALLIVFSLAFRANAQENITGYEPNSRILFIFDASYSMAGPWGGETKINIARRILEEMVDSIATLENVEMALRIYGHQSPVPPQDCSDTKLEVPFASGNAGKIREKLRLLSPRGTTPIAHSLELAANDFPDCQDCRNIIILITDGVEACDGDPCAVSIALQEKGIALRPFVIGIGSDPGFQETFGCIGYYFNAPGKKQFREVMKIVISQALNTTSAQVNLIDIEQQPSESDVAVIFFDQLSGKVRYNMIHTLNNKGNPDTLALDHLGRYRVVARTIPPVSADSVELVPGKHNHIGIDAPQGYLQIISKGDYTLKREKVLVKRAGDPKTINVQFMGTSEKYLVGRYDVEIPVYPLIFLSDVEIRQSYTTTVEIPEPGMIHISSRQPGYGSLFRLSEDGDQEWVLNIRSGLTQQEYHLQPGRYRIIFRLANRQSTIYTQVKDFTIRSGISEVVEFK